MSEAIGDSVVVRHETRPPRKLILLRATSATDYWGYCEERGCDVWEILSGLQGTLGEPVGLWLPECLRRQGTSVYVMGVEAPADYSGPVPEGMEVIELPSTDYLVFQGPPYSEDQMSQAIGHVWASADAYRPEPTGWRWSTKAPRYQLAPIGERGYIEGRPVVRADSS